MNDNYHGGNNIHVERLQMYKAKFHDLCFPETWSGFARALPASSCPSVCMFPTIYFVAVLSKAYFVAAHLCSVDGWKNEVPFPDSSFLLQQSQHSFVIVPDNSSQLNLSMIQGSMLVCHQDINNCASWFVRIQTVSWDTSRTMLKLNSVDSYSLAHQNTLSNNCSFAIPPCFLAVQLESGVSLTHHNLDHRDHLRMQFRVSMVHFEGFRRNTTQQNTSNTSATLNNAHNNGSVSESPSIYEPRPEPYMYGVPDWYLHAVVKLSNPDLVDIYVEQVQQKPFEAVVLVDIWQKEQKTGSTDFELHLPAAPASCGNRTVLRTNIIVGCPSGKSLSLLDLGNIINGSTPVYMLPVNYRPPSSLGHDIALSPHVYNVDPSQPLRSSHFEASKTSYNFKQCKGKLRRSDCNCTEDMRATGDVAHTDCIDRAYEHYFGNPYALRFVLTTESGGSVPAVGNCTFLEVNNRTDFIINSGDSGTGWFVVHPEKSITFRGSGLYHFLFEIVSRESFCHLNLYLLVFVSKQPMTKAAESFVNILSTFLCGVSLLCVYFCYKRYHKYFHHHHLHPHH